MADEDSRRAQLAAEQKAAVPMAADAVQAQDGDDEGEVAGADDVEEIKGGDDAE